MKKSAVSACDDNMHYRSRYFRVMLYTDNPGHMQAFDKIKQGYSDEYLGIVHKSLDDIEKEHIHIVLMFVNPRVTATICSALGMVDELGIPDDQFVRAIVKTQKREVDQQLDSCCIYLTHRNAPEKEQYPISDVFGTSSRIKWLEKKITKYIQKQFDMSDSVSAVLDWIASQDDTITAFQFGKWLSNTPHWRANSNKIVWSAIREHNLKIYKDKNPVPHSFDTLEQFNEARAFDLSEFQFLYGD